MLCHVNHCHAIMDIIKNISNTFNQQQYVDVWLMSMFLVVLDEPCWMYKSRYVSSKVCCYKCVKKAIIDDITMIECGMIMTGFGQVWEHDNHTLNVMELRGHAKLCY